MRVSVADAGTYRTAQMPCFWRFQGGYVGQSWNNVNITIKMMALIYSALNNIRTENMKYHINTLKVKWRARYLDVLKVPYHKLINSYKGETNNFTARKSGKIKAP